MTKGAYSGSGPMPGKDTNRQVPVFYRDLLDFVHGHPDVHAIVNHIKNLAQLTTREDFSHLGPGTRAAGHRAYDAIISEIFTSVIRAISREELLKDTIEALSRPDLASPALCLFVLEALPGRKSDQQSDIKLVAQQGLNEHLWLNFAKVIRTQLQDSPFLRGILVNAQSVDLWLSSYISNYKGEFDVLARASRRRAKKNESYWISAIALNSEQIDRPNRVLIALYENRGDEIVPKLPSGATQEWRVFHFLGIAYKVLNHQLRNIADEVHGQRQKLLSLLAPGILHHEIGAQIDNMNGLFSISTLLAQRLDERYGGEDAARLRKNIEILTDSAYRLYNIADAFNNMEIRKPRETVSLAGIMEEVYTLTHHRLGKVGAQLIWDQEKLAQTVETDPALLLHLILNIVINATNVFEDSKKSWPVEKRRIAAVLSASTTEASAISLNIFNNGPGIPDDMLDRIFEKGFTTRPGGHGHGLYICRLIAEALGGRVRALHPVELPPEWSVGFQLDLPLSAEREVDLMGESQRAKR